VSVSAIGKAYSFKTPSNDDVLIGDIVDADFHPKFTLTKWNGNAWLKFAFDDNQITKAQTVALQSNKVVWDTPLFALRFYPLEQAVGHEDGGLEFELILKTKPQKNSFSLSIQTQNLAFYYQPSLTQEFNIAECFELSETYARLKSGREVFRPEPVVGSYAVYHASKANGIYKNGKAFHIYRPKLTDADGKTAWADLDVDVVNGVLTLTLPQAFLDAAKYPVVVDPTFGYTSIGASTWSDWVNWVGATKFSLSEAGTVTSMTFYNAGSSDNGQVAIYDHDAGNDRPGNRLLIGSIEAMAGNDWHVFNVPDTALSAGTYWLAWGEHDESTAGVRYDSGFSGLTHYISSGGGILPSSWYVDANTDRKISIYATYTTGGTLQTVTDSVGLSDSILRHKAILPITDGVGLADAILRHKTFAVSDSVGASDLARTNKSPLIVADALGLVDVILRNKQFAVTDAVALAELVDVIKGLILKTVTDSIGLTDAILRDKIIALIDACSLFDAVSTPSRGLRALDAVGLADGALVNKILQVTESISIAEVVEVGAGGVKKTRLFLVLGDLAVQLTGD